MRNVLDCTTHTHSTALHWPVRNELKISLNDSFIYVINDNGCALCSTAISSFLHNNVKTDFYVV